MGRSKQVALGVGGLVAVVLGLAGAWAGYALATFDGRMRFPGTAAPPITASTDPVVVERGRYLVHGPAHCSACHSGTDRSKPEEIRTHPLSGGLEFAMGPIATTWSANLTSDPETGLGRYTDAEIARTIRTGVAPDGTLSVFMRTSVSTPSDEDLVAIVSYLRSLPPVRNEVPKGEWKPLGKLMFSMISLTPRTTPVPAHVAEADEPSVERGQYLAENITLCVGCHSPYDMATFESLPPKAGGGHAEPSHGPGEEGMEYAAPNLTSHPTGKTGQLTEDEFVARIRSGRVFATSIMPWENFQDTSESDLRSIYRYLRSLPPVDNDNGPGFRPVGWKPEGS